MEVDGVDLLFFTLAWYRSDKFLLLKMLSNKFVDISLEIFSPPTRG